MSVSMSMVMSSCWPRRARVNRVNFAVIAKRLSHFREAGDEAGRKVVVYRGRCAVRHVARVESADPPLVRPPTHDIILRESECTCCRSSALAAFGQPTEPLKPSISMSEFACLGIPLRWVLRSWTCNFISTELPRLAWMLSCGNGRNR